MKNKNNIEWVVNDRLCTGCGTCSSLCPKVAITMTVNKKKGTYNPEINNKLCINCGICIKVCPGHEIDFNLLNQEIFGRQSEDPLIGNFINCYVGYSEDREIRYNSSSGGLVTQILIFALESNIIDGALVTRMKKDQPLEPEPFLARTKEEIYDARGSKYCPVPANIGLKKILSSPEGQKFAVVGLPCHIHGIRKAEQINEKLKEKIILHIGLYCGHSPNFSATKLLINRQHVKGEEIRKIAYRGDGWPGFVKIRLKNDKNILIPHGSPYSWGGIMGAAYHTNYRCDLCIDGVCEFADISFGDAWLSELMDENMGTSVVISRSGIGESLLQRAKEERIVNIECIVTDKVYQSQKDVLISKKTRIKTRIKLYRLLHLESPKMDLTKLPEPRFENLILNFPYCIIIWITNKLPIFRLILCKCPLKLVLFFDAYIRYLKNYQGQKK